MRFLPWTWPGGYGRWDRGKGPAADPCSFPVRHAGMPTPLRKNTAGAAHAKRGYVPSIGLTGGLARWPGPGPTGATHPTHANCGVMLRDVTTTADVSRQEVPTAQGPAAVRVLTADTDTAARGTLLLGHGAGGRRDAADILALTTLTADGWTVVLVDQPWRVAGRRVATPPPTLDVAWRDVIGVLAAADAAPDGTPLPRPWVIGGRSAGARVACRTSVTDDCRADPAIAAVVCLAFPLHPPGRPERTRVDELAGPIDAGIPTLVVQGDRDPMGRPDEITAALGARVGRLTLRTVVGAHSPTRELDALTGHVRTFVATLP